ncbi:hypothetical protein FIBSPDRAFT_938110 [Athelia psychrophila]|uniref:Uncharacterized protein n=1 Tax=Athelia psychrophila TaxID=1759441 RepID=A0A165Z8P1_9AGAM|nr:hypothetical protein FIBSPDRAFT_938110 [Fibularhizoctonia sp. CBS 109695]
MPGGVVRFLADNNVVMEDETEKGEKEEGHGYGCGYGGNEARTAQAIEGHAELGRVDLKRKHSWGQGARRRRRRWMWLKRAVKVTFIGEDEWGRAMWPKPLHRDQYEGGQEEGEEHRRE